MQNLKDINKKKEANIVLLVSILLTAVAIIIPMALNIKSTSAGIISNIAGAAILSAYYKKYFPDDVDYPKKKITKPLIIAIILTVIFILLIVFQYQAMR